MVSNRRRGPVRKPPDEAADMFSRVLELDPNHAGAKKALAANRSRRKAR